MPLQFLYVLKISCLFLKFSADLKSVLNIFSFISFSKFYRSQQEQADFFFFFLMSNIDRIKINAEFFVLNFKTLKQKLDSCHDSFDSDGILHKNLIILFWIVHIVLSSFKKINPGMSSLSKILVFQDLSRCNSCSLPWKTLPFCIWT